MLAERTPETFVNQSVRRFQGCLPQWRALWHVAPALRSPHSSGVEHSLGKGEAESSNLSVGTIFSQYIPVLWALFFALLHIVIRFAMKLCLMVVSHDNDEDALPS